MIPIKINLQLTYVSVPGKKSTNQHYGDIDDICSYLHMTDNYKFCNSTTKFKEKQPKADRHMGAAVGLVIFNCSESLTETLQIIYELYLIPSPTHLHLRKALILCKAVILE